MFEVNDKVKWFDYIGSMVPNCGQIIKLTPKFADVFDVRLERVVRVRQSLLKWS